MNEYVPDKWKVVKIEGPDIPLTYKVFACWCGGYLGSNSWKLNSGIKNVSKDGKFYLFEGYSGSVYKCHESLQGLHMYGIGVLGEIIYKAREVGANIEVMPEDTDWLKLDYNNE
jgi:hypothetical protein